VDVGNRIRDRRKALSLSQEALARRADVSLNLINKLERGVITDPHYSTLIGVARALGMSSIAELVGEGKAGEPSPKVRAALSPSSEVLEERRRMTQCMTEAIRELQAELDTLAGSALPAREVEERASRSFGWWDVAYKFWHKADPEIVDAAFTAALEDLVASIDHFVEAAAAREDEAKRGELLDFQRRLHKKEAG